MTTPSWRDAGDRPVEVPPVPGEDEPAFYRALGEFQGASYHRNAFAAGTDEEGAVLAGLTGLAPGTRVLDVGCGDGRHLRWAARTHGSVGCGVEVSPALVAAGRAAAAAEGLTVELRVGDARQLATVLAGDAAFDVAWSLHQGAIGTSPTTDAAILAAMAAAVRPGGQVVVTVFHALFAARHLAPGDAFDPVTLVHHQEAEVHGPDHTRRRFGLWTSSVTVPQAARMVADAGLELLAVRGVEPGRYGRRAPGEVGLDDPELLLHARRPLDP